VSVAAALRLPRLRTARASLAPRHAGLAGVLGLSAALNLWSLSQNGWANTYYSGAVDSMLRSWHNFLFVSFDAGGLVSVDKPPLALWLQAASAKVFGLSSLSLLLPEAIAGVLAVAVVYRIVRPRFGTAAALASALALAVFPSFVAVARDNNPDVLLILLMVLACGAALKAIETGRLRSLLWCAVLVGLAFNTKMLAAYLVVPGIALAYLVCAPGSVRGRLVRLGAAGATMLAVSAAWLALVDLTPASKRPYVGSSQNNSAFSLAFNYNGVGRVEGQLGGPGQAGGRGGGRSFGPPAGNGQTPAAPPAGAGGLAGFGRGGPPGAPGGGRPGGAGGGPGGARSSAFGGPTGAFRLFSAGIGDQGGWMLPFALVGALAVALTLRRRPRRDPRLAALIVFGGWFAVEAAILSYSKGIIHPYYVSALGPSTAVLAGAGAVAMVQLARRGGWRVAAPLAAVAATVAVEVVLLRRVDFIAWWIPLLLAIAVAGALVLVAWRRQAAPAMAALVLALALAPAAYATTVWDAPVSGIFPAAGKSQGRGPGGPGGRFGGNDSNDAALARYVRTHAPGSKWDVLVQSSTQAAPLILEQHISAGSLGGFNGDDRVLDADGLAKLVASGEARYVQSGSSFPGRGGNDASTAVQSACREVPASVWGGSSSSGAGAGAGRGGPFGGGGTLYDCQGAATKLAASG
jgi:4-amino-4-deoxy-L-arabinose transferase-like glycosyltransferase